RDPERVAARGLAAQHRFSVSYDGSRLPCFLICPADVVSGQNQAGTPTVLYGYGGFEISQKPCYLSLVGKAWLEAGGVFAMANIRGGGEYGPQWHQAALKIGRASCRER